MIEKYNGSLCMDGLIEFTLEFYRLNDENELKIPREKSNMQQNQMPRLDKIPR